jgi:hypothetical protein
MLEREELDPDEQESMGDPDGGNWFLGAQMRGRGSIHSDVWFGNAAQLAEKSNIAVFPVGGWWKDWKENERHSTPVRYLRPYRGLSGSLTAGSMEGQ